MKDLPEEKPTPQQHKIDVMQVWSKKCQPARRAQKLKQTDIPRGVFSREKSHKNKKENHANLRTTSYQSTKMISISKKQSKQTISNDVA